MLFWKTKIPRRLAEESSRYVDWVDPINHKRKGGLHKQPRNTKGIRKFNGICALMDVRDQPSTRDYWTKSSPLYCEEVALTMSRNRFQHTMRVIHLTPNNFYVKDKKNPHLILLARMTAP